MTQKAIAKECADWIKEKVQFKSNKTGQVIPGLINIENKDESCSYYPVNGFTTVDLGCDRGNNCFCFINKFEAPLSQRYIKSFNEIWNDKGQLQDVTQELIDLSLIHI